MVAFTGTMSGSSSQAGVATVSWSVPSTWLGVPLGTVTVTCGGVSQGMDSSVAGTTSFVGQPFYSGGTFTYSVSAYYPTNSYACTVNGATSGSIVVAATPPPPPPPPSTTGGLGMII